MVKIAKKKAAQTMVCIAMFACCGLLLSQPLTAALQGQATITIRSENADVESAALYCPNLKQTYLHEKNHWFWTIDIPLNEGQGVAAIDLNEPVFMRIRAANLQNYSLFISPGDQLDITIPATENGQVSVTGKGSENNQLLNTTVWFGTDAYDADTLPERILNDLRSLHRKDSATLTAYIQQHNPTKAFIDAQRLNLQYFVLKEFYRFASNHKFALQNKPNGTDLIKQWNDATERLIAGTNIDHDAALITPNYTEFIRDFLLRKKEALWTLSQENIDEFARDWYDGDQELAMKSYREDPENLLIEKIINRYFSGETAAFAYAHLIGSALGSKEDNLVVIFENFKAAYPANPYLPFLEPSIDEIRKKESRPLTDRMLFADENGSLKTFEQVLAQVKGKTVLLDMWGTWCGPCREEIDKNSQALKDHFKGKNVDFLYVANYDLSKPEKWKKLIAYYGLEGIHILASQELTEDIMKKTGGRGYPTYVVIKPDGSYELSQAGYPMNREELIKQIEAAL